MADTVKILNKGLELVVDELVASSIKHVGWGTGTTTATEADTGLETPAAESRTSGTQSKATTTTTGDTYRIVAAITCATAPKAITEVAVYDAGTSGNGFLHATIDVINVGVGDSINFTINTKIDQSA